MGLKILALLLIFLSFLSWSGCVSRKTYETHLGLAAITGYTAGMKDCGKNKQETSDNVSKRIRELLAK